MRRAALPRAARGKASRGRLRCSPPALALCPHGRGRAGSRMASPALEWRRRSHRPGRALVPRRSRTRARAPRPPRRSRRCRGARRRARARPRPASARSRSVPPPGGGRQAWGRPRRGAYGPSWERSPTGDLGPSSASGSHHNRLVARRAPGPGACACPRREALATANRVQQRSTREATLEGEQRLGKSGARRCGQAAIAARSIFPKGSWRATPWEPPFRRTVRRRARTGGCSPGRSMPTSDSISRAARGARVVAWCVAFVAATGAIGAGGSPASPAPVRPLAVLKAPVPPVGLGNYRTSGFYPQFADQGRPLEQVDAAVGRVVRRAERSYARATRRRYAKWPQMFLPGFGDPGTYKVSIRHDTMSASTRVVSALLPVRQLYPGGNGGAMWLSFTLQVPSVRSVPLAALFAQPARALAVVARAARR